MGYNELNRVEFGIKLTLVISLSLMTWFICETIFNPAKSAVVPVSIAPEIKSIEPKFSLAGLSPSLLGTTVDGATSLKAFAVGENPKAQEHRALRDVFDYFLSTVGDNSLGSIQQQIELYLENKIPGRQADSAKQVFKRYLAYQQAWARAQAELPAAESLDTLISQLHQRNRLRREFLGLVVAEGFFLAEEKFDNYSLQKLKLLQQPHLSYEMRQEKIKAMEAELPLSYRQAIKLQRDFEEAFAQDERWRQTHLSAEELQHLRAERWGIAAAKRLASHEAGFEKTHDHSLNDFKVLK